MRKITRDLIIDYLLSHESDIHYCVNDFGSLIDVFVDLIGRQPERKS